MLDAAQQTPLMTLETQAVPSAHQSVPQWGIAHHFGFAPP